MLGTSMRSGPFVLAGTLLVVFFAGCLGDETSSQSSSAREKVILGHRHSAQELMAEGMPFDLEMNDCVEGGGVSLYNMQEGQNGPVTPFKRTSISEDTGRPMVASYGQPIPPGGATTGIWHTSVICQSYAYNGEPGDGPLEWGWVGVRIQPPEWDTSGITRQYFIADLSLSDPNVVKALQGNMGLHASRNLNTRVDWLDPAETVLYTVLDDEDHGVFETWGKMKDWGDMPLGKWRFWMLVSLDGVHAHGADALGESPGAGTRFKAISFDIENTGEGATHKVVDGTAMLSHTRTDAHGTGPVGAQGNVGGLIFEDFDRRITIGPSPDLEFNRTWLH